MRCSIAKGERSCLCRGEGTGNNNKKKKKKICRRPLPAWKASFTGGRGRSSTQQKQSRTCSKVACALHHPPMMSLSTLQKLMTTATKESPPWKARFNGYHSIRTRAAAGSSSSTGAANNKKQTLHIAALGAVTHRLVAISAVAAEGEV